MDRVGARTVTPRLRPADADMPGRPWIADFSPSYIARAMHLFPKQGDREPWLNPQSYSEDKRSLRDGAIDDGVLCFSA